MENDIAIENLPTHVAIIMDGNGRWAKSRGEKRLLGHKAGALAVREITTYAREIGIKYLTLYAFSQQNFGRPADEVKGLMQLLVEYVKGEWNTIMDNGIRLTAIGDIEALPLVTRTALNSLIKASAKNSAMTLCLALAYGGREEITVAMQKLAKKVAAGELAPEKITKELISENLYTAAMPDPDLIIRTSGEMRISNFLLWQLAYSEFYITDTLWPDFHREEFLKALKAYAGRERRFGLTSAQISAENT